MCHPFEKTLGLGPYKFVGEFTIKVGSMGVTTTARPHGKLIRGAGTCAHCGMAIMNVFQVQIGNGDVYGVGCDCIRKVGLPAAEMSKIDRAERQHQRELRQARKANKEEAANVKLLDMIDNQAETLDKFPHPHINGMSLLDYACWIRDHNCNKLTAVGIISHAIKSAVNPAESQT